MFNETFAKQVFTLMVRKPAAVQQQSSFFWPSGESSSFIMAWGPQGQLFESWGALTRASSQCHLGYEAQTF